MPGEAKDTDQPKKPTREDRDRPDRTRSRGRRAAAAAACVLVLALVSATTALTIVNRQQAGEITDLQQQASDREHAESVAGKYAVASATYDFNDLSPWVTAMKPGVSQGLAAKYDGLSETLKQVIVPSRMQSKGSLVVAKATNESGGILQVSAVVKVESTSLQAPDGRTSNSAFSITVDREQNWQITGIGGGSTPGISDPLTSPQSAPTPPR